MARVLRNRAIVIAEDDQATTAIDSTPLQTAGSRTPFNEKDNNEVAMTVDEIEMEQELKELKAAYKVALNGKKKRKPRKGKKAQEEIGVEVSKDEIETLGQPILITEAVRPVEDEQAIPPIKSMQGGAENLKPNHPVSSEEAVLVPVTNEQDNTTPAPVGRATRQQMAKQQAQAEAELVEHEAKEAVAQNDAIPKSDTIDLTSPQKLQDLETPISNGDESSEEYAITAMPPLKTFDGVGQTLDNVEGVLQSTLDSSEDSFVEQIVSRSPCKPISDPVEEVTEDSFVAEIVTRSPAKKTSRISDSIEDLDKLEEALEALEEATHAQKVVALPQKDMKMASKSSRGSTVAKSYSVTTPVTKPAAHISKPHALGRKLVNSNATSIKSKTSILNRKIANPTRHEPKMLVAEKLTKHAPSASLSSTSAPPAADTKPTLAIDRASSAAGLNKRLSAKRPISLMPPKLPVKSSKPPTVPSFELPGAAIARQIKEKREARLAGRPSHSQELPDSRRTISTFGRPTTIRSTKPPTTSTFELPGDELSRRKRQAHETRLKIQEEEERKRREFKARPIRNSVGPSTAPRDTAASLARKSLVGSQEIAANGLVSSTNKRSSVIVGDNRPAASAISPANVSASHSPGEPKLSTANTARKVNPSTMSGLRHKNASSVSEQRGRAKEIYNRGMKSQDEAERERREKEERARKSREEAAERGREASRKWAEQRRTQLAKMDAGKGLEAGFGPGGQMGLKAA